jgi:ParB-like chromosome segregation protein Spo0J
MKVNELFASGPLKVDWERVSKESPSLFMLAESIKKEGMKKPIEMRDGKISDGIHRLLVLWLMGYRGEVPVTEV